MKALSDVKLNKIVQKILTIIRSLTAKDVGAISYTLLWSLPEEKANAEFAEQTVNIDLSEYDGVKIIRKFAEPVEVYRKLDGTFPTGTWGSVMSWVDFNASTFGFVVRKCTVTDTGIHFDDAVQCNAVGSGHNVVENHNTAAIPVEIYGIKGFRKTIE